MKLSPVRAPMMGRLHSLRSGTGDLPRQGLPDPVASTVSAASRAARMRRRSGSRRSLLDLVVSVRSRENGAESIVRVTGEIDLVTVPALTETLDRAQRDLHQFGGVTVLVVDLRSVRFLGAAGMRALVDTHNACTTAGTHLRIVADQTAVTRPLALTGLDRVLELRVA